MGCIISWKLNEVPGDSVAVYDLSGAPVARAQVLATVPQATGVSVSDVAVKRSKNIIAVAAVYVTGSDNSVQSALMLFDLNGKLTGRFNLVPSRGVGRLAIDNSGSIWTLTASAGDKDPKDVPLVVEYDAKGQEIRSLLRRSSFSIHAAHNVVERTTGSPAMGVDANMVWVWLPGSNDLVTIDTQSGSSNQASIALPNLPAKVYPNAVFYAGSGRYLLKTIDLNKEPANRLSTPVFEYAVASSKWTADPIAFPDCAQDHRLIGISDSSAVMLQSSDRDICVVPLSSDGE